VNWGRARTERCGASCDRRHMDWDEDEPEGDQRNRDEGCAAVVVGLLGVGWLVLLGLMQFGASMTTDCRHNVHTAYCDGWRTLNLAAIALDVFGVAVLAGLPLVGLLSGRVARHPLASVGGMLTLLTLATIVNVEAVQS